MIQETIQNQNRSDSSIFPEPDDDNHIYKNCIQCGQAQYPHKHGMCHICGTTNWTINYENPRIYKIEKLGIVELMDN